VGHQVFSTKTCETTYITNNNNLDWNVLTAAEIERNAPNWKKVNFSTDYEQSVFVPEILRAIGKVKNYAN